jgi:hypothetical protein
MLIRLMVGYQSYGDGYQGYGDGCQGYGDRLSGLWRSALRVMAIIMLMVMGY